MASGPNLFARLHKWAAIKGQEENFFTESLAVVLEHLLNLAPETGVRLVSQLTDGFINLAPNDAHKVGIRAQPQVDKEKKKADLELRTSDRLAWIEVKVSSPLRKGQLKEYRGLLKNHEIKDTRLFLLTLKPGEVQGEEDRSDRVFHWFQLADWLESELDTGKVKNEVGRYLAEQLLDLLQGKSMAITKVGWQLPEGIRDLKSLLNMLDQAIRSCMVESLPNPTLNWIGYYLFLNGKKCWIGLHYVEPEKLRFCTEFHIDKKTADQLGLEFEESGSSGVGKGAVHGILDSEAVHFFERSKTSQMQWLLAFLCGCLDKVRSINTLDKPTHSEVLEKS